MTKLSVILAALGVALLAFSFVPSRTAPVRSAPMTTPIPAQVVAATPSSAPADIAYGRALFSAKGCVTAGLSALPAHLWAPGHPKRG